MRRRTEAKGHFESDCRGSGSQLKIVRDTYLLISGVFFVVPPPSEILDARVSGRFQNRTLYGEQRYWRGIAPHNIL